MAQATRTQTSRVASARPAMGGNARGVLDLDPANLDPAVEYMWATETVYGADLRENVRLQMSQRGFSPVLATELPNEAPPLLPGEVAKDHDVIRRGGCVLMKRPRRLGHNERAELAEMNAEALRSVNRDFRETVAREGAELAEGSGVKTSLERVNRPRPGSGQFAE